MKELFPGYFRRTEEEWKTLWDGATIVLDTNFLLDLYRYSEGTRSEILELLSSIQDRLFIPYQVAYEFMKNRLGVIAEQGRVYDQAILTLQKIDSDFNNNKRHPFIAPYLLQELNDLIANLVENLGGGKKLFDELLTRDTILDEISNLFKDKIGNQLEAEDLEKLYIDGEERYKRSFPPGYKDNDKPVPDKFGDLIIWKQIIALALDKKCPILFITSDSSEDWWWIFHGKTIGPRHELVKEIRSEANVDFHIYLPDSFIQHSAQYLQSSVEQQVIDEIKEISKQPKEVLVNSVTTSEFDDDLGDGISEENFPIFPEANFSESDRIQPYLMNPSLEDARKLMIRAMKILINQNKKNIVPKAVLKNLMKSLDPTFDESNYDFASFTLFLGNFPNDIITLDNYSGGHVALFNRLHNE